MSRPSIQRLSKNRSTLFSSTGNLGQSDGRKHEGYFCPQGARFAHSDPARRPRFPPFPPIPPVAPVAPVALMAEPPGGLWLAGPGQDKSALPAKKRPTCRTLRSPESKLSKAPRRQQKVCPESPADCRDPDRHNHCSLLCPSGRQIDPWGVRADLQGGYHAGDKRLQEDGGRDRASAAEPVSGETKAAHRCCGLRPCFSSGQRCQRDRRTFSRFRGCSRWSRCWIWQSFLGCHRKLSDLLCHQQQPLGNAGTSYP